MNDVIRVRKLQTDWTLSVETIFFRISHNLPQHESETNT